MFSLTEATEKTGLKDYQLRTYEEKLEITIKRNEQGHRIYSEEDIELLCEVKKLKEKGYTLESIKEQLLKEGKSLKSLKNAKKQVAQLSKIEQLKGEAIIELWKEQQKKFVNEFLEDMKITIREEVAATIREDLKDELILEIKQELTKQEEQRENENEKLMQAIKELREKGLEEKKKKFLFW